MKQIIHDSFFGLGPGPTAAPTMSAATPPGPTNVLYTQAFRDDATTWPDGVSIHTSDPKLHVPYWITGADKTRMETYQVVTVNSHAIFEIPSGGGSGGYFDENHGIYDPGQQDAGRVTNDTDFSLLYDAVRGYAWVRVDNSNPSSGLFISFGERPTTGGTSFGVVGLKLERSAYYGSISNRPATWVDDGEGSPSCVDTGSGDCMKQYRMLQWEFIKGTHLKVQVSASLPNIAAFAAATWPISGTTVAMTGTNLAKIVPTMPLIRGQSGTSYDKCVRIYGCFMEYRAIGNEFATLV